MRTERIKETAVANIENGVSMSEDGRSGGKVNDRGKFCCARRTERKMGRAVEKLLFWA